MNKSKFFTILFSFFLLFSVASADTVVISPNASGVGTTTDGGMTSGYEPTISLAHAVATGDGGGDTNTSYGTRVLHNGSGYYLARIGMSFDLSVLPVGALITSAEIQVFGTSINYANASDMYMSLVQFSPNSPAAITAADFGNFSYDLLAPSLQYSAMDQSGYNSFPLNSDGLALLTPNTIASFGLITEADRTETSIGLGEDNIMTVYMSDNGSNKPKLIINYTTGSGTSTAVHVLLDNQPTYLDWIIGLMVIIFLLTFMPMGLLYNNFKEKKEKKFRIKE